MESENVANLIAGGALLVSLAVWVRSEVAQRKSAGRANAANEAARRAGEAAERSAKAAEASLELEGRSTAALEKMADQWGDYMSRAEKRDQRQGSTRLGSTRLGSTRLGSTGPGGTESGGYETRELRPGPWAGPPTSGPSMPVVHWTVDKVKGRRHRLTNLGRATAYEVKLAAENAVRFDGPDQPRDIDMGEAVEFLAIGSLQTGTPEVVVSWSDTPGGERREWRRPVP